MEKNTYKYVAVPVLAAVYTLLGALSIILLLPGLELVLFGWEFSGDLMLGFVMLVVAGILAFGSLIGRQDQGDWLSFAYVGTGLAVLMLVIQLVLLLVDSFNALVLELDGYEIWTVMDSLHPALIPGLISLILFLLYRKDMKDSIPSLEDGESC